jgi:arylsulfatase A-like enzyme
VLPGTTSDQVAITFDLTASLLRIAGAAPPADRPLDGIDIVQRLEQGAAPQPRTLFWRIRREQNVRTGARDGDLKYVYERRGATAVPEEHLFDLRQDPGEKTDLLHARPADAARLRQLVAAWEAEVRPTRPELTAVAPR